MNKWAETRTYCGQNFRPIFSIPACLVCLQKNIIENRGVPDFRTELKKEQIWLGTGGGGGQTS